jgi:hypothetical protein
MGRKGLSPNAELLSRRARTVIRSISENAEDTGGEEKCDRNCHSSESLHEKVDWVPAIKFEGRTSSFSGISPWVIVVKPVPKEFQRTPR